MTDAELGFYIRCLNHAWINKGLPVDPGSRAKALRSSEKYSNKMWLVVGKRFEEIEARMVNPRQETERLAAETKSRRATDSIRSRYERRPNVAIRASDSVSVSSSLVVNLKPEAKTVTREGSLKKEQARWFSEEFWPDFWLHKGKSEARRAFESKATSEEIKNHIVAAMRRQRPEMLTREPRHRKWAQGWLNSERFDDELESEAIYTPNGSGGAGSRADRAVEILMQNLSLEGKL